ncbi:MAG: phytanoyl-CoA dioxygenase family protein [Acidimicrobiia bacterium]
MSARPSVDEVCAALDAHGYCVVEGLLSSDQVRNVRNELRRILAAVPEGRNPFEGYRTRRIYALFAKTRACDALALDPLVLGTVERVLGRDAQLGGPTGIDIEPGEVAQMLHRDEDQYPVPQPAWTDLALNVMWALDDFTAANGATRVVPSSHRGRVLAVDGETPTIPAEMPAGSAMLYLGSLWHGGGANTTDAARLCVAMIYVAGWLRTQENQVIAVPRETVRELDPRLQELLGWGTYRDFLGAVDGRHPRKYLRATAS